MEQLSTQDLINLIHSVFPLFPDDRFLGILVDIPRNQADDSDSWRERRSLAEEWSDSLSSILKDLDLDGVRLFGYPDVGSNNADLPEHAFLIRRPPIPHSVKDLEGYGIKIPFDEIFNKIQIFLAPTQYSTTAPLKNAAKQYHFRAATMPGFSSRLIPTLKIDYTEVNRRVLLLKEKLDPASGADVHFLIDGQDVSRVFFDLRFRQAHASTGRFPEKGTAGNLPSGEAYIVPYEGEQAGNSQTSGVLPVQIGDDLVLFDIEENRAVAVKGDNPSAEKEAEHLQREPAYGNVAELGFGVLSDFGIQPMGEILLDEKLGFHVAFGRSEHFGGAVGPGDFSSPEEVIHLDRIYIPATQPRVAIKTIDLHYEDGRVENIMERGKYTQF